MPTASLRAPEGYHLVNIMQSCMHVRLDLFLKFGGHPGAAGFTLIKENLIEAKHLMSSQVKPNTQEPIKFNQNIETPKEWNNLICKKNIIWIKIQNLDINLLNQVFELDPFGQDFPLPSFGFKLSQEDILNYSLMGNDNQHLKIEVNGFKILYFNADKKVIEYVKNPIEMMWIIAKPNKSSFRQKTSVDLILEKFYVNKQTE